MLSLVADAVIPRVLGYLCLSLLVICIGLGIWVKVLLVREESAIVMIMEHKAKLEVQNQAVKQWQQEAASQAALTKAAVAEAGKVKVITRERVERILEAPVPSACPDAILWGAVEGAKQGAEWGAP